MRFVNLNGKLYPADAVPIRASNSAFRYGLGLFETLLVTAGEIQLATYHWQRLWQGMRKMGFEIPSFFTEQLLTTAVEKTTQKNQLEKLCRVRLQVFTDMDGLYSRGKKLPEFLIECFELEPSTTEWNENGWICGIAEGVYKSIDANANLKSCNMLPYIAAAQQAQHNKWNDALLMNVRERIIESSIANIFWVQNGALHTPPLSDGCIAGVMRSYILNQCRELDIPVFETILEKEILTAADEVFLTNAIRRIKWLKEVNGVFYSCSFARDLYRKIFS